MRPKALFADAVSVSHTSILIGELTKLIKQNGVDVGAKRLFSWLREKGYLIKEKVPIGICPHRSQWISELFEVKETTIARSDGSVSISKTPKVTGKGQIYFVNKFCQNNSRMKFYISFNCSIIVSNSCSEFFIFLP